MLTSSQIRFGTKILVPEYSRINIRRGKEGDRIIFLVLNNGRWQIVRRGQKIIGPVITCFCRGRLEENKILTITKIGENFVCGRVADKNTEIDLG